MQERTIDAALTESFATHLRDAERSAATLEKYLRDVRGFAEWMAGRAVNREEVLAYKKHLGEVYAVTGANSVIAALNVFFRFCGWYDFTMRQFRVQRAAFCGEERELSRAEYARLVHVAKKRQNERLYLMLQTICATGIRVSELEYITVEAVRCGRAEVRCKGKERFVFLVSALQKKLLRYVRAKGIVSGSVFVTRTGRPIGRCNVWREMKGLCSEADVLPGKVFPHNLRHLFARCFYKLEKDMAKLADLLGHSNINTTRIYIVTTAREHRQKMEHLHLIL